MVSQISNDNFIARIATVTCATVTSFGVVLTWVISVLAEVMIVCVCGRGGGGGAKGFHPFRRGHAMLYPDVLRLGAKTSVPTIFP